MSFYDDPTLAVRSTVREMVSAFQLAESRVRIAFAMIVDTQRDVNLAFCQGDKPASQNITIQWGRRSDVDFENVDTTIQHMARCAWVAIVDKLELRRFMSVVRWNQLEKHLQDGALPPITEENIFSFAKTYRDSMHEMLKEAVDEVFNMLRPPSSRYKTNSELEIPPRVILSYAVEPQWSNSGYRLNYNREQSYQAVENVLRALDGRGNIAPEHYSELSRAIKECGPTGHGETEYFEFRCFQNKNLHLRFKRLDLLKKLNMLAGGKRLAPERAA